MCLLSWSVVHVFMAFGLYKYNYTEVIEQVPTRR